MVGLDLFENAAHTLEETITSTSALPSLLG